jgi:hypothetical protein
MSDNESDELRPSMLSGLKPWEETWRTNPLDGREVECPIEGAEDGDAWRIAEAYMGSDHGNGFAARAERARFIAAAPDMARALLESICDNALCGAPQCRSGREALKKAGVIP